MQHYARALLDNPVETTCNSLDVPCSKWSVKHIHEIWPYFAEHSIGFIHTRAPTECMHTFSAYSECMHLYVYVCMYVCMYIYTYIYIYIYTYIHIPDRYESMKFIMCVCVPVYVNMSKCEYLCLITISRKLIFAGELRVLD
jgi:hypothetical protein